MFGLARIFFKVLFGGMWTLRKSAITAALLLAVCITVTGCVSPSREIVIPLRQITDIDQAGVSRTLIVFLPGLGDTAEHFVESGFFKAVRERALPWDLVSVDAHLGYYTKEIIAERLDADVIQPALDRGYTNIWLVGVSMGGLGAMLYAQNYPGKITGIVAIAPYLGDNAIIKDIRHAGGLRRWAGDERDEQNFETRLWHWLKAYIDMPEQRPPLYLLYGDHDKLSNSHKLLAGVLPAEKVHVIEGRHEWATWKKLWVDLLEMSLLP